MALASVFFSVILILNFHEKVTPELRAQLDKIGNDEKICVIVGMAQEYPFQEIENFTITEKAQVFRTIARSSQQPLIEYLSALPGDVDYIKPFWVFNGIHLKAAKRVIEVIAERNDIAYICASGTMILADLESGTMPGSRTAEWNIQRIMADSCWYAGFTGDSILIGFLGTGCDFNHPALQGKWSGYWHDFVNGQATPYDDHGHGTFNIGIICGGDGPGTFDDDIGVAPGAKLVVAKCFDQYGSGTYEAIDSSMQWMADLKADSSVDIRTVANPWGSPTTTELHWWDICNTWKSLRILGVFGVGGQGPGSGTVCTPANYPTVMGIGATDNSDNIASFSARGPAPNQNPWNDSTNWYRPDWNLIKPDIAAPGVNIRSCYLNNAYQTWSGTSMASSHVPGAIAILCEANPDLIPAQIYNLLLDYADEPSQGAPYPNNTYGWGRMNIWWALRAVTAVNENSARAFFDEVSLLPNPTTGMLRIKFSMGSNLPGGLIIYDVAGRTVQTERLSEHNTFILSDRLRSGIYFVDIEVKGAKIFKKLTLLR